MAISNWSELSVLLQTFWCAIVCHWPLKYVFCLGTLSISVYCIISQNCAFASRTAVCKMLVSFCFMFISGWYYICYWLYLYLLMCEMFYVVCNLLYLYFEYDFIINNNNNIWQLYVHYVQQIVYWCVTSEDDGENRLKIIQCVLQ